MTESKFQKRLEKIRKQGERAKQEKMLRDEYDKYLPNRKKRKVSNIMLVISVFAIVGYVIANFILQLNTGVEVSSTISTLWFAFWTVEIFALAGIKVSKTKYNYINTDEEQYDDIEEEIEEENIDEQ